MAIAGTGRQCAVVEVKGMQTKACICLLPLPFAFYLLPFAFYLVPYTIGHRQLAN